MFSVCGIEDVSLKTFCLIFHLEFVGIEFQHHRKDRAGNDVKLDENYFRNSINSLFGNARRYYKEGKDFMKLQFLNVFLYLFCIYFTNNQGVPTNLPSVD